MLVSPYAHICKCLEEHNSNVGCFLVPEVPKKPTPEEKVPAPVPKKPEPAKGRSHLLNKTGSTTSHFGSKVHRS